MDDNAFYANNGFVFTDNEPDCSTLKPGSYHYCLLANGEKITRKLVVVQ